MMATILAFLAGSASWYGMATCVAGGLGFFGYAIGNWRWIAVGVTLGATLAYVGTLKGEISTLSNDKTTLTAENASLGATLKEEKDKTARLEEASLKIAQDGERKKQNAALWKGKYEESTKKWQEVVGGLGSWTPTTNEGDCDAAKRLLATYPR